MTLSLNAYVSIESSGLPCFFVFFFKQKTAYEMRISDWSSDVCSSDLLGGSPCRFNQHGPRMASTDLADASMMRWPQAGLTNPWIKPEIAHQLLRAGKDRKSVV